MPITRYPSARGGTDWSKYTPFTKGAQKTIATGGVYETILSVTGKGYLSRAILESHNAALARIRITIDGVQKILVKSSNLLVIVGMMQLSEVSTHDSSSKIAIREPNFQTGVGTVGNPQSVAEYPATGDTQSMVYLPQPIFFNTSLLIEVTHATNGGNVNYEYQGGTL